MATEIRFAFALNGGVSLAIWIGGVVDEILRLVDGGKRAADGETDGDNPYVALCRETGLLPKVDVLAGSSVGGLNAAFLGTAIIHGCTNMHPIKQLWLDHGSFDKLLRRPTDDALISLLNGDANFLPHIESAFELLAKNGRGFEEPDPPVTVRLTATSLGGRVTTITDGHGSISSVDHRGEFVFHTPDFDFAADDRAVARLARACRSTASFPGAFEPSTVPVDLYEERHAVGLFEGVTSESIPLIDGAVLVNLPAQTAIEAIIQQPSRERTERVLALVVPDPGEFHSAETTTPSLNEVLSKSIVGIPRTQSLTDFIEVLNEHNLEVRSRRAARAALLAQFATAEPAAAWADLAGVADTLFPSYRATLIATSLDRVRLGLPARLPRGAPPVDRETLDAIDPDVVPWVPNALDLDGTEWCWGSATASRLAAVVITWLNEVAAIADRETAQALYAVKEQASAARAEADRIWASTADFERLFVDELDDDLGGVAGAFERASRRWPSDDSAAAAVTITALNDQLVALARTFADFVAAARGTIEQPPDGVAGSKPFLALRGLVRLHDGAAATGDHGGTGDLTRLLLCVEVVEATFAGTEPRPDQEVRLVQFTSKGAVAIDPLERSIPMDKLAGVELAHFGAFLKRSWRANDWMWGRLDSAERVIRLIDSILDHCLTEAGTLESHTRAVQAAILREELPTVLAEIEQDAELGARVSAEGKAFCAAVREKVGTPTGPVDLSGLDAAALEELFTLQLVGSENLEKEVGSNLATVTSIAALATTAGVVKTQGPRLIRTPVRVFGASSSLAWRIARRRRGRRLRILEGALVIVIGVMGVVGVALDLFTSADLGAFRYFAWAFLVLAPVLAVFAAPWLLLGVGRRAMGKPRPH